MEVFARIKKRPKHKIRSGNFVPAWYVRTEKWKVIGWDTEAPVLFDMINDIGETTDLAGEHPEVVQQLKGKFAKWMDRNAKPAVFPAEQFDKFKAVR